MQRILKDGPNASLLGPLSFPLLPYSFLIPSALRPFGCPSIVDREYWHCQLGMFWPPPASTWGEGAGQEEEEGCSGRTGADWIITCLCLQVMEIPGIMFYFVLYESIGLSISLSVCVSLYLSIYLSINLYMDLYWEKWFLCCAF